MIKVQSNRFKVFNKKFLVSILFTIYLIILGALGFSMLGQFLILNVMGLPISLMEIYWIPVLVFLICDYNNVFKSLSMCSRMLFAAYLLLILGLIIGIASSLSIIFAYRSIIYLLISYLIFKSNNLYNINLLYIFIIAFSAVIGELIFVSFFATDAITSSMNCLAVAIAIFTSFILKKYIFCLISIIISMFLAINTGFRIGIVIVIICIIELIIIIFLRCIKSKKWNIRLLAICMPVIAIIGWAIFVSYYSEIVYLIADITGMDEFAVFRVTERLEALLKFDFVASQDGTRLKVFKYVVDRIAQLLPRGLVGEVVGEYWLYIDVPIIYLYDIFGSLFSLIIVLWFLGVVISNLKALNSNITLTKKLSLYTIPIIIILFIINGSFMVIVYQAVITGFILGNLTSKRKFEMGQYVEKCR